MKLITPQFITDSQGKKLSVILPVKDYNHMLEELEELSDIRMYDEVKARNEPTITMEDYLKKRKSRGNA